MFRATEARRWAIDDTDFLDWYCGLRRLFRHGARPGIVVLGAQPKHLIASHVRGGYFAHYLMDLPDFLEVAARLDMDATGTSELLFSHLSAYHGSREELPRRQARGRPGNGASRRPRPAIGAAA
jgi:hypothetical protein